MQCFWERNQHDNRSFFRDVGLQVRNVQNKDIVESSFLFFFPCESFTVPDFAVSFLLLAFSFLFIWLQILYDIFFFSQFFFISLTFVMYSIPTFDLHFFIIIKYFEECTWAKP